MSENLFAEKARQLRESFDRQFALPAREENREQDALLMLRVNAEIYGVKIGEIGGLFMGKKIIPVPTRQSAFLGLIGVKGNLVPVWSLAELLGYASAPADLRWFIVGAGAAAWALAFDGFEGYRKVLHSDLCPAPADGRGSAHAPESCRMDDGVRPVLRLASLRETIQTAETKRRQTS